MRGVPVFDSPGNPVSPLVSYELLARPAIRRLAGTPTTDCSAPSLPPSAVDGLERRPDGKLHLVRVISVGADGRLEARSSGGQGSHQMGAMAVANGLALVADGPGVPPLGTVPVLLTGELA